MTAATHVCVLCMRYCNGITAYILLPYLTKFHFEITKDKEMTTFLYELSDHPSYNLEQLLTNFFKLCIGVHIRKEWFKILDG